MEIKASVKYDYRACRTMAHAYSYKKSNPLRAMLLHILLFLVLGAADIYVAKTTGERMPYMLILGLCLLMVVLELVMYFLMPKLQYNSMAKMKDMENTYLFRDEDFIAETESREYKGDSVIRYTLLERVMETKEYFLLFENKRQAFLVDKETLENGTAEELRTKLQPILGKKYVICKF